MKAFVAVFCAVAALAVVSAVPLDDETRFWGDSSSSSSSSSSEEWNKIRPFPRPVATVNPSEYVQGPPPQMPWGNRPWGGHHGHHKDSGSSSEENNYYFVHENMPPPIVAPVLP